MIFSEFYPSFQDIETEYHEDILELIDQDIPSLNYLKSADRLNPNKIGYYLLFEEGKNSPVGLIRQIRNDFHYEAPRNKIWQKIFLKDHKETTLSFSTPGLTESGIIAKPHLKEECLEYLEKIIKRERDPLKHVTQFRINLEFSYSINLNIRTETISWKKPSTLVKSSKNFQEYLESLPKNIQQIYFEEENSKTDFSFESLTTDEIKTYSNYKKVQTIFSNTPQDSKARLFGIIINNEILSVVSFIEGTRGNTFVKYYFGLAEKLTGFEAYLVLNSIKEFFDNSESNRLRVLNSSPWPKKIKDFFYHVGFDSVSGKTALINGKTKSTAKRQFFNHQKQN